MHVRVAWLSLVAACWTGTEPAPSEPSPPAPPHAHARIPLEVTLERTPCFGFCPVYSVTIRGDGEIAWNGDANVAVVGRRSGHATHAQLVELDRAVAASRFFERDEYGDIPAQQANCFRTGNTTTCTFQSFTTCSDTSHSIITVHRGSETHRIDNAHCDELDPVDSLERLIDRIADDSAWIGR